MTASVSPALILILGAFLTPFLRGRARALYLLALPVLGLVALAALAPGNHGEMEMFGYRLVHLRVDALSRLFVLIFLIAAFLATLYALHVRDLLQQVCGPVYAGAAIGAVLAGDLMTLFVYWELTAISSVFLIWASGSEHAWRAGMRYLIIQIGSGVLLAAGAVVHGVAKGTIEFGHLGLEAPGGILVFLAFGIKCAFPLLHNWLQDAYPESTVTGTVFLSAFTTKLAVYALARGYAGTEMLIWIGALMTAFPIFYAVIENDLRRVLSYSLNNQLGFMVAGIGIGTELAVNGAVSHAFAHILYKALLFMSMGAVLFRVGTCKGSELGGLYKSMPWTTGFCIVGALSISAFPLFSGFVTKSMILTAAAEEGHWKTWLVLLFASAGVFHHSGIKIPFFAFFAHDSGKRCPEAPVHMLIAMALTAFLCVAIGVWHEPLYALLPYPVDYAPYTTTHVVTMLQLLFFSGLAFATLQRLGIYPSELRSTVLDFDWLYRRAGVVVAQALAGRTSRAVTWFESTARGNFNTIVRGIVRTHGPEGILARTSAAGTMAMWIVVLLAIYLVLYFL